jgi:Zn-finger nucleic acid-binding protein
MELIESRRYFRCGHCGNYHFPEAADAEGIRIVGQPADAPRCPLCKTPMAHALLDNDDAIDFCAKCRGIFLPRATFARVVDKRRAFATAPPAEPVPLERKELQRQLSCPRCAGRFETYPHFGPGNIVIDNCTRCDMIWLDFGELRQIVDAPGKDRGTRHAISADRDDIRPGRFGLRDDDDDPYGDGADPLWFLTNLIFRD